MARSKEHAIQMWKDGEWDFDDYQEEWGEYNEVIDEVVVSFLTSITSPDAGASVNVNVVPDTA